jgi:hypothetical protein
MSIFTPVQDEESSSGFVEHAHSSAGFIHFHLESITASTSYIVIDLSDTTNYFHLKDYLIHLDKFWYRIDADNNASYRVNLWAIDDITSISCTRTMVWSESGEKATDVNLQGDVTMSPYGPLVTKDKIASTMKEAGYEGYNLSTPMKSTIYPSAASVTPGNGDLILEFIMNEANPIEPHFLFAYHTHSRFHA